MKKDTEKMFFYSRAVVNKEPRFNWLKYEVQDPDENTRILDRFKAGQIVEIYIKEL